MDAEAAEYYRLAGEHAQSVYANRDALGHYETTLALGHPDVGVLHETIGDLHTLLGKYSPALVSYEAAALGAPSILAILILKLGNVYSRRGDLDLAQSHYGATLAAFEEAGNECELAKLHADLSLLSRWRGDPQRVVELPDRALELAEKAGDNRALAQIHHMLGILCEKRGERASVHRHPKTSLSLAESLGDPDARLMALNNLALACLRGERPDQGGNREG